MQSFAKVGLIPDSGGTFFLPRLVGEARARALAMTADALPAETAAAWGLIWKAVDDDALQPEAESLTARLAAQPTGGLALIKRALAASPTTLLDVQHEAGQISDRAEGVRASGAP